MTEILRLILTDFWAFAATVVILAVLADGLAAIVYAWRRGGSHD